jgi:hypothetical protein
MAIVFDGPVSPDALTTFVRQVPQSPAFALDQILPNRYLDRNSVDFAELVQTNRTARFRAYDARLHVSERDAGSTKQVKLPALSTSISMGEYERLQLEFARTGGTNQAGLANAIYNDGERLTREILARMEQARGDVLTDFKFTLAGEGNLVLEADFGAPAGHLVTPATPWTTLASATVLSDLIAWNDVYVASNGNSAGAFWTSQRVARLMQRNAEVIAAVAGTAAGRTRVTAAELNDLLASEGLPEIRTYDASVDVDGTTTRVIPDDRLLFVPAEAGSLGFTAWGISATALELVNANVSDIAFEDAQGIVGVVEKSGPPYREFTYVDAVGMPIISNPRGLLVADVAA